MKKLEAVVRDLESGNVELEKSIALYEEGARLKAHCEKKLKEAEEKVARITLGPDGAPTGTVPVEGL
jgi:exodeoxyribonuclease VII small subunit